MEAARPHPLQWIEIWNEAYTWLIMKLSLQLLFAHLKRISSQHSHLSTRARRYSHHSVRLLRKQKQPKNKMAQTLGMPVAPALSVICNGHNNNLLTNASLSFPVSKQPQVISLHFILFRAFYFWYIFYYFLIMYPFIILFVWVTYLFLLTFPSSSFWLRFPFLSLI